MKLTAIALLGCASVFGADPALLNLVMPDAKMVAGVNVTTAKTSPLGQYLISQLPPIPVVAGFDPLRDVSEILAASTATGGAKPTGLMLMSGTFDVAKLAATLPASTQYKGATIIPFPNAEVAFLSSNIAIAGDAASVTAAIDRQSTTNTIDPALLAQITKLSANDDVWMVSTVSPGALLPSNVPQQAQQVTAFLANIDSFSAGAKFGANIPVTLDVVANSPQNAQALGNLLKLATSMLGGQVPAYQALLQTLQVNTTGSTLSVAVTLPEATVEGLIASTRKKN
jgi:hypothetical protein